MVQFNKINQKYERNSAKHEHVLLIFHLGLNLRIEPVWPIFNVQFISVSQLVGVDRHCFNDQRDVSAYICHYD